MSWEAAPEWEGETAFIVAGGPSVSEQNLELLHGRKVIVINSSVERVPWADYLVFGDWRWFKHNKKSVAEFKGVAVTTADRVVGKNIHVMRKAKPPGLATDRRSLTMRRTSLTAAINLAAHLGVKRIVLLGADGQKAKDGRTHHHKAHPWPHKKGCWDDQKKELETMVGPLRKMGIEVLNASPGSAWNMWPYIRLEEAL